MHIMVPWDVRLSGLGRQYRAVRHFAVCVVETVPVFKWKVVPPYSRQATFPLLILNCGARITLSVLL